MYQLVAAMIQDFTGRRSSRLQLTTPALGLPHACPPRDALDAAGDVIATPE